MFVTFFLVPLKLLTEVCCILLPWVPEVFLACGGKFRCWPKADTSSAVGRSRVTIKTWQKPETALEKSLAPRVAFFCPSISSNDQLIGGPLWTSLWLSEVSPTLAVWNNKYRNCNVWIDKGRDSNVWMDKDRDSNVWMDKDQNSNVWKNTVWILTFGSVRIGILMLESRQRRTVLNELDSIWHQF